ncbi:MAG: DUF6152 family protein [Gammaproteobacteria bacterium]|nr:DUF6152 family protein [Gammaproteobacteria bacterium]MDH3508442.1 DUF6152 family protein [Gammaproteobacteria bacterium]
MRRGVIVITGLLLGSTMPAVAHHSRAGFELDAVTAVQGRVADFNWSNPHVYIEIESIDEAGAMATWVIETDAIPILLRSGWTSESVSVGDSVLVRANPGKEGNEQHGLLVSLAKDDGTILLPRAHFERDLAPARATARADSLAGVWELPFGETGDFMQRWAAHELTPAGRAGFESFSPEDRPSGKCIANPTPQFMAMPFLNEIELQDDRIIMRSEFLDAERVIYMDGREHPADGPRTTQGHSIGSWEDDVLVIDTTLFADHRAPIRGPREGVPSGAQRHVVERLQLSDDGTRVDIEFLVEDPEFLTEPFTGTLEWRYVPDFELSSFTCTLP